MLKPLMKTYAPILFHQTCERIKKEKQVNKDSKITSII